MIRIVTNGRWGYSSSHRLGSNEYTISCYQFHQRDGKPSLQRKGDKYGLIVHSSEEVDRIGLEHGYTQPYTRNYGKFVMSRAARKRGIESTDFWYNRKASDRKQG